MYLKYYGLKEKPFSLSPDPKYLYCGPSHKEALSQMVYAVTQDSGFMTLSGEVGTGKTLLVNSLVASLPEDYLSARIYYTILSPKGLIQNICKEFRIAYTDRSMAEMMFGLQDLLNWRYKAGKKTVLILDEAQNLSRDALETVRLMSNVEAVHEKILQILLVGQPELEEKLRSRDLRQLRERIGLRFRLSTFSREETKSYINHRLAVAGKSNGREILTEGAIDKIYALSEGVPRRINILSDSALLLGYARSSQKVDRRMIEKVGLDHDVIEKRQEEEDVEIRTDVPVELSIPTDQELDLSHETDTGGRSSPGIVDLRRDGQGGEPHPVAHVEKGVCVEERMEPEPTHPPVDHPPEYDKPVEEMESVHQPSRVETDDGELEIESAETQSELRHLLFEGRMSTNCKVVATESSLVEKILWSLLISISFFCIAFIFIEFGLPFVRDHYTFLASLYEAAYQKVTLVLN